MFHKPHVQYCNPQTEQIFDVFQNKNREQIPLSFNTAPLENGSSFRVITPSGKEAACRRTRADKIMTRTREKIRTLKPGERWKSEVQNLSLSYDFSEKGNYKISLSYANRWTGLEFGFYLWTGNKISEEITVTVQ